MKEQIEIKHRIKRYFGFDAGELKALLTTIFVYGLIISFSFDLPGSNILFWFNYLLPSLFISALAILVHVSVIRIFSLRKGYRAEYRMNFYVLAASLIISILFKGKMFVIVPGIIMFHMLEGLRIAKFRYGINWWEVRWPIFSAVLANLVIALVFRALSHTSIFAANPLINTVVMVNLSIAFFSMLPLPDFEGFYIYYSSALVYAFTFSVLAGACIAILLNLGLLASILIPAAIGIAGWLTYLLGVELK
jgi:hypothetical protein